MTIGEHIRDQRLRQGLTQRELGERAGIAEPTIRRYELGKLNPKIETVEKIAKALGVPTIEFYDDPYPVRSLELRKESALADMFSVFITKLKLAAFYQNPPRPLNEEVEEFVSATIPWYAKTYGISKNLLQMYAYDYLRERSIEYISFCSITPTAKRILELLQSVNEEGQLVVEQCAKDVSKLQKYQRTNPAPEYSQTEKMDVKQ